MPGAARILLVDDDPRLLASLGRLLRMRGLDVTTADTGSAAIAALDGPAFDIALVDYGLPDMTGAELTRRVLDLDPALFVIGFTGQGDGAIGFEMLQAGARQYLEKGSAGSNGNDLLRSIPEFVELSQAERADERGADASGGADPWLRKGLGSLLGKSSSMRSFKNDLANIAEAGPRVVLLVGESGVGKSHVARALHGAWARSRDRLVEVNCAALNRERIGPLLFGTEGGTFTSVETKKGAVAAAGRGTLFLDEFGLLEPSVQAQLLTLMQEWRFTAVGAVKEQTFDGRIICATNENLDDAVQEQRFRKDLYFRINRFTLRVPPLRERRADIPLLAYWFLDRYSREFNRPVRHIPDASLDLLCRHSWRQNNVRELENVISSAVARCRRRYLEPRYLRFEGGHDAVSPPPASRTAGTAATVPASTEDAFPALLALPYREAKASLLQAFTEQYCRHQLERAGGNRTHAARLAGMQRPNFYKLLARYDIHPDTEATSSTGDPTDE